MILVKVILKVTVKVIEIKAGIHALSVLVMVPRNSHSDGHISFNYFGRIYQGSRFGKAWQNRAGFNLALNCDFVILVNLALSCQGISLYLAKQISL
jgi:hypothetical protein